MLYSNKKICLVIGPTASGKTDKAIELAKELNAPILSADSRQIYKELNIGVAKPSDTQLAMATHYFINHVSIFEDYNVGQYVEEARLLINQLFKTNQHIIVCGGTGLYINSLFNGIDNLPPKNETLRQEMQTIIDKDGIDALIEKNKDWLSESLIKSKNPQRIIRAIEIRQSPKIEKVSLPDFEYPFEIEKIFIQPERDLLYQRINDRVDDMIANGLEAEARSFYKHRELNALKTVGYSEWWPYFENLISKTEAIEKIKQHTRNYAKRQLTWFRNQRIEIG
jgi:tRNA dimethylallyltransferase